MSMSRRLDDRSVFDRRHGPAVVAAGDGQEGAYSAILNTAPSNGTVKVIVPNLWGLTTVRTAVCSLAFAGNPGDRVLVVFDEEKQPWVVDNLANAPWSPVWVTPTLLNSWTRSAGGSGADPAGYVKDPLGSVHLRGRFSGGASGSVVFTLPAGFRPGNTDDLYAAAAYNGSAGGPVAAFADITSAGSVALYYATGASDVSIGGITFLAEN